MNQEGVIYLEADDINSDGSLVQKSPIAGKKAIVMCFAAWCGHCKKALPMFAAFAREMKGDSACLLVDTVADPGAAQKLSAVNSSRGIPAFLLFGKDGKFIKMYEGNRDSSGWGNALQSI